MRPQKIKESINIVEIISRYVHLQRSGSNYIGICPFHNEKTPSFNVNPAKGIFKCFGCGAGGDAIDFIQEIENIGFPDAIDLVEKITGIAPSPIGYFPKPEGKDKAVFTIPPERVGTKYGGYEGSTLYSFFTSLLPGAEKVVNNVFSDYRVMSGNNGLNVFPNVDIVGRIRQIKELTADPLTGKRSHTTPPKVNGITLLSPEEKAKYRLRACLYGEHLLAASPEKDVVICESEKTAIGMTIWGHLSAGGSDLWLATGGKNGVNLADPEVISPLKGRKVYLMPDNDAVTEWRSYIEPLSRICEVYFISGVSEAENDKKKEKWDVWDYTVSEIQTQKNKKEFVKAFTEKPLTEEEQDVLWRRYKRLLPEDVYNEAINEIIDSGVYEI